MFTVSNTFQLFAPNGDWRAMLCDVLVSSKFTVKERGTMFFHCEIFVELMSASFQVKEENINGFLSIDVISTLSM